LNPRITLFKNSHVQGTVLSLPSSKSLSNRALILNALSSAPGNLENLSSARDTKLMQALIHTPDQVINVMDAGTTMRFLTAYFGITDQHKVLTGTDRMKERPLHLLVNALRSLGVTIDYLEKDGFPPIETKGFSQQRTNHLAIRGDVSSQFISALMMIAPVLPQGLTLTLEGKVGSWPYLRMTAALMGMFGVEPTILGQQIKIQPGTYQPTHYKVEADWSAASYWFAVAALATEAAILLPGVTSQALQGDRIIVDIMQPLGVNADFRQDGMMLTKGSASTSQLVWDFSDCPDLAQTVLPVCAARNIPGEFTGLESLRIKETDRIHALQQELQKLGATLSENSGRWYLQPGPLPEGKLFFNTYHDHRMAMGFAPIATLREITIQSPDVVNKSYPTFWSDLNGLGFQTETSGI